MKARKKAEAKLPAAKTRRIGEYAQTALEDIEEEEDVTYPQVVYDGIGNDEDDAAEEEERLNYSEPMNDEWLNALEPLGTNAEKPFLEIAPLLIVVFRHAFGEQSGQRFKNYYTQESVGIATGFLLAALHYAGLATLTHTPSPMGFLSSILGRPKNEKPFLLIPVGFPAPDAVVPTITKKPLEAIRINV